MWPTIPEGSVVSTRGLEPPPEVGDVVVARHPFRANMLLVKRIRSIGPDGYELVGDAAHGSEDSRGLGLFPLTRIVGVVTDVSES